ncbi:MAG: rhomboid family intramembrane serine protease [Actinomycetota bacterium]
MLNAADPFAPATCYRHPDRQTRLACSTCGRPICVECSRDAAVGQKCPDCARPEGRHRVITAASMRSMARRTAPVTYVLIAVNLAVFVIGQANGNLGDRMFVDGAQYRPLIQAGEWWRLFTAMFLHANIAHIGFNMWALFLFGPALERRFGSVSFTALYLASGLGGGAMYHLVGRMEPAIGASGAIFGLFGALIAATYRQRHTPAGRAVFSQLVMLLALNLAIPLIVPNVAWEAHLGGLVAGVAIAAAWDRLPIEGRGAVRRRVAVAMVVAGVAFGAVIL